MKKLLLVIAFASVCMMANAQKPRFGLAVSPALSWVKGFATEVNNGKVRAGVDYGLLVDISLGDNENYAVATGINVMLTGGNVQYDPGYVIDTLNQVLNARFKVQYLKIPISFKLKTNQIGYITYWGSIGVVQGFRIQARLTADAGGETFYDNVNLIRDNSTVFKAKLYQMGLEVGGGIEYALNDRTALLVGLIYHNAFIDAVDDHDKEKVLFNHVALRAGIMF